MPTKSYKIEWLERRTTTTGKQVATVTLSDETGAHVTGIGIWTDFPGFAELMPGSTVQGSVVEKGQYKTLYPVKQPSGGSTSGQGSGMRGVAAAQTRKGDMIEKAQDTKNKAIQIASAFRDSTLMVIEMARTATFETMEEKAEYMARKHKELVSQYLKSWDNAELVQDIPFKDGESAGGPKF